MDHDAAHKYLYMLAPVMADLLRLVVPDWADDLELATPEDVVTVKSAVAVDGELLPLDGQTPIGFSGA